MSNFKLEVGEVLGFKYQRFISAQKSMAISDPKQCYKERDALDQEIKEDVAKLIYEKLFTVLTKGSSSMTNKEVQYPPQKINDVVLDLVASLAEELADIGNLVFPDDFTIIADSRLVIKQKGESTNIGTGGVIPNA